MNDLSIQVGKKIKLYRKERGMTQLQLGDKIGVKNNTISAYERGAISPEQDMLFALCSALNVNIDDLFPRHNNRTDELDRALRLGSDFSADDVELINGLINKALSMSKQERALYLKSLKFATMYYDGLRD